MENTDSVKFGIVFKGLRSENDKKVRRDILGMLVDRLQLDPEKARKAFELNPVIILESESFKELTGFCSQILKKGGIARVIEKSPSGTYQEEDSDRMLNVLGEFSLFTGGLKLDLEETEIFENQLEKTLGILRKNDLVKENLQAIVKDSTNVVHYLPQEYDSNSESTELHSYCKLDAYYDFVASKKLYNHNNYLKNLHPSFKVKMKLLYDQMSPKNTSEQSISTLASELIPLCGFVRGCIYMLDRASERLVPAVAIGSSLMADFQAIDVSPLADLKHPVSQAYKRERAKFEDNSWGAAGGYLITAPFGYIKRTGVIYLETSGKIPIDKKGKPMDYFNALHTALMDCLGVR